VRGSPTPRRCVRTLWSVGQGRWLIIPSRVYVRSIQDSEDHYERPDSKGSQRGEPTPADSPGRLATAHRIYAGERLPARLPRTYPDALSVPGGQGVAGSSPAVPTVFRTHVGSESAVSGPSGNEIGLITPSWPGTAGAGERPVAFEARQTAPAERSALTRGHGIVNAHHFARRTRHSRQGQPRRRAEPAPTPGSR
jgi:hypothetical protein